METGIVALGHSSLHLIEMPGLEGKHVLQITRLKTDPAFRNQGEATKLMQEICRRADMSKFLLVLGPARFDGGPLNAQSLEDWYKSFGFRRIQDKPVLMCRDPKQKVWNIETDQVQEVSCH